MTDLKHPTSPGSPGSPASPELPTYSVRRRWAGLAVLASSLLVVVMDMTILNVALPDITTDLRPGAAAQLWMVDIYALVLAGLLVPFASLADRFGRKRMLIGGFTLFGAASMLVLVADTSAEVIAVRALLGVGGAMIMPTTISLIRTLFTDPRERATALGVWAAMASVGGAIGPIVGGALLEAFSWHAAFLFNVPVMVIAIVAGVLILPESRSDRPGRLDAAGVVLSVAGMVGVVYAVKHLGADGFDVATVAIGVGGLALLVLFVRRCLHQPEPMLEVRLFSDRAFSAGVLAALVTSMSMIAVLLVGSQWLQVVQGLSPLHAGAALLPLAVGGALGSPLAPSVADRIGARAVLVGGLLLGAAGLLLLVVVPQPLTYGWVAVAFALVGLGTASLGVSSAVIMGSAPVHQAGSAAAIEETAYEIGGVLGVALLGSLAGVVYRAGLPGGVGEAARESVSGATGESYAAQAFSSFGESFAVVGLAGGLLMLVTAVVVWRLVPRTLDLADAHH